MKCVAITIETRPDYCLPRHMDDMLSYGCTRLEIGVQSTYEDVARDTNRGHTVQAVCECFHFAKDTGYKVVRVEQIIFCRSVQLFALLTLKFQVIHMMPNLPNVPIERDVDQVLNIQASQLTILVCSLLSSLKIPLFDPTASKSIRRSSFEAPVCTPNVYNIYEQLNENGQLARIIAAP